MSTQKEDITFAKAIIPIGFFFLTLVYGLFIHPVLADSGMLPVEVLVLLAITFSIFYLFYLGYDWDTIQEGITKKIGESIPVVLILFAIGVLIGSWIVSGTIPMMIYHGISWISPDWIYIFSFLICIVFSLLTGTSWGSAGTIGVVMIGISQVYDANIAITAAAVVGGSFFGDKMSPLSDTTNIASLATGVPLMDHIKSMAYTTGPAAILASIIYIILSPAIQGSDQKEIELESIQQTLTDLDHIFYFNPILLLPLVVVIWGSLKKKPIFITLLSSAWVAMIMAYIFQSFSFSDIFMSFKSGFNVTMAPLESELKSNVVNILNRGGLYNLIEGVVVSLLVFAFIGTLQVIDAIQVVINKLMTILKTRSQTVVAALLGTLITNMTTSNQYATSFIIGAAFDKVFDKMKIPRKVLSRSIEDAGTMMENLAPWTPSGLFMASTLGVSALDYAPYQFISLINIVIAFIFAMTGIACFYNEVDHERTEETMA